jgi:hypothetical protein
MPARAQPGQDGFARRNGLDVFTSVGLSNDDVRAICFDKSARRAQQRLSELHEMLELLLSVYTIEGASVWLFSPSPMLDGESPVIAMKEGRLPEVTRLVALVVHA